MPWYESLHIAFLENFWYLVVFGAGAVVGSFLNVVIYRMPLGLSIASPKSHCPRCNYYLGFWDNIPLLSFLFLRARCRYCRVPISWRYFTVELLTASLWTCLFHLLSDGSGVTWVSFAAQALFVSVLVAVIFIDLDHFLIPDELNWVGIALGLGRDLACLALAWYSGPYIWKEYAPQFSYFGWLPRAIPGALVYGGLLFLVSFIGFLVYAREENEPLGKVARRFFIYEEEEEADPEADRPIPASPVSSGGGGPEAGMVTIPNGASDAVEEGEEGEPVRLRFSPGFLAAVSALLLFPVIGAWASLAFVIPFAAFGAMSRQPGEAFAASAARFFRANDQVVPGMPAVEEAETAPPADDELANLPDEENAPEEATPAETTSPVSTAEAEAIMAAEADQFAREAETGKHGAMGLGDVKLALAIGAILGPGPAILSLFVATASGAITGLILARLHGKSLRYGLPFGPFMALGAIVVMLYGEAMLDWYLRRTGLR